MILVLERGTSQQEAEAILEELRVRGLEGRMLTGGEKPLVHIVHGPTRAARALLRMERVQGLVPTSGPRLRVEGRRFYPYHFIGWCSACLIVCALLVLVAGFLPPGLGQGVQLQTRPEFIAAPWYLRPFQGLMMLFPPGYAWAGWMAVLVLVVLGFLVPALDRSEGRGIAGRWPALIVGFVLLAGAVVLGLGVKP